MPGINKEVRSEILAKVKAGEPVIKLSKDYGVSDKTIYGWLRAGVNSISALEVAKMRNENNQLKQIIGVLTLELQKTKKKSR